MPITYIIILLFIGLILNVGITLLSLKIFRINYTWKQFSLLIFMIFLYHTIVSSILYGWNMKMEDMPMYYAIFPAILLELWMMYSVFRVVKIPVTWKKYIGIMSIQVILSIILSYSSLLFSVFMNNGASMVPTISDKDFIFVNKINYIITSPKHDDIIVIRPPTYTGREYYIKRVIAISGDTIRFESGSVFLKTAGRSEFQKLDEPFLFKTNRERTYLPMGIEETEFLIPPDSYWVMGDNRQNSADSRHCFRSCDDISATAHYISRENIVGKVISKL